MRCYISFAGHNMFDKPFVNIYPPSYLMVPSISTEKYIMYRIHESFISHKGPPSYERKDSSTQCMIYLLHLHITIPCPTIPPLHWTILYHSPPRRHLILATMGASCGWWSYCLFWCAICMGNFSPMQTVVAYHLQLAVKLYEDIYVISSCPTSPVFDFLFFFFSSYDK